MRDVRCLNCHSEDCHELLKVSDVNDNLHTYFKCENCSLVYLRPLPSEEEMNKIYAQDYYGEGENEKFKAFFVVKLINTFARCRARRFASHLNKGARIMDVGCGNGRLLEHLHSLNRNFELHGIEIQPMAVLRASRRLKGRAWIHTVNGLEQFFGKNAFDAISYVHVFEHLPDPAKTMDELIKRTKEVILLCLEGQKSPKNEFVGVQVIKV